MKHVKIVAQTIPAAYRDTLTAIWNEGEIFNVGHGSEETDTKKLDVTIHIIHPETLPLVDDKAPTDTKHIQEYGLTYLWTDYLGDHPYTYGWRLKHPIDQIEEVIKAILEKPSNRQLTMTIRIPEDAISYRIVDEVADFLPVKVKKKHEPPCLTCIDIEVLNGKINMTCYFRSWDAYAGLPENIAGLYLFLDALVSEINERGKTNYETGQMIFHSKNCHIYKRVYSLVEELVNPKPEKRLAEEIKEKQNHTVNTFVDIHKGDFIYNHNISLPVTKAPVNKVRNKYVEYIPCSEFNCNQRDICRGNINRCAMSDEYKPKLPIPNPECTKCFSDCSESDICGGYCSDHPKYSKN